MRNRLLITVLIMAVLALAASCKKSNNHPGSLTGTWVRFDATSGNTWIFEVSDVVLADGTRCTLIEKDGTTEVSSYAGALNYDSGNGSGFISFGDAEGAPKGNVSDATDDSIRLVVTRATTSPMAIVQGVFTKENK